MCDKKNPVYSVLRNLITADIVDANSVVREALVRMEVEDKQQTGALKRDHFISIVFA